MQIEDINWNYLLPNALNNENTFSDCITDKELDIIENYLHKTLNIVVQEKTSRFVSK